MRNPRPNDADCRLAGPLVHCPFDREWRPRDIALLIAAVENAEVLHEFQEVKDRRGLGGGHRFLSGLDMLTGKDDGRHDILHGHAHSPVFGTIELSTGFFLNSPVGLLLNRRLGAQSFQQLWRGRILEHARGQVRDGDSDQFHFYLPFCALALRFRSGQGVFACLV